MPTPAEVQAFVDRFRAKATKARQVQSRIKALERMERIAPAHVDSPFHFEFRPPDRLPSPLLGLERIAMYLQNVENVYDLKWNENLLYGRNQLL